MQSIRILADDLTGALDTAAAFAGQVPVYLDRPPAQSRECSGTRIAVVATPTRDVPPEEIPAHLQPALKWLQSGRIAFKKVDSLLRGNTFAELAWLVRNGGFETTIFAPAFPAQGRVTIDGQQWVVEPGDVAGSRKAAALPFGEAFADQGICVESGALPTGRTLAVWAPDIVSDQELDAVVAESDRDTTRSCLWCGSAGLAHALARHLGLVPNKEQATALLAAEHSGPTLLISASHHPVFRAQWQLLNSTLSPQALAEGAAPAQVAAALASLREGARSAWLGLAPAAEISPAQAAQMLHEQMAQLIASAPKPAQLIVVGGDTLLALCRAAKVEALLAQASIRNGWGCARLMGGAWDGVSCYSRSGAFGGRDDLVAILRLLAGNNNPEGNQK